MKKWTLCFILILTLLVIGTVSANENGYVDGSLVDPAITVGDVWFDSDATPPAFYWEGSSFPVDSYNNPYYYSATGDTSLYITDAFVPGDQFEVRHNGNLIGTTPVVPVGSSSITSDPVAAYADPQFSHACFTIPGSDSRHVIDITTIAGWNPQSPSGRGYIMVQNGPCPGTQVPEFPSLALPVGMLLGITFIIFILKARKE
jgi:hypothetical protein